ncbi:MAG: dihydrodipicolinate synthase family protein [Planctomycetaceae bacterium]|nr:dihydrodipicolinate synthase family protein [Planctomycetaceae bacterium]
MSHRNEHLKGVFPVFQTPYCDDESIDFDVLQREIEWLFESGCDGIVPAMVSEVLRLSDAERKALGGASCRFAGDLGATILSVGAESTVVAVENAKHAQGCGAAAVMAIPPVSIGATEDDLADYYEQIVQAIEIPVIIQDASGYVGKPMSISFQSQMLKQFGADRILFKPEAVPIGPRLSELRDATQGCAHIYEGTGGISLVDSYRRGIAGTMPGADLIQGIVALYKALQAGDEKRIYELSLPISAIISTQNSLDAFLTIEKHLLVKQGVFRNTIVRGPKAYSPDQETLAEVDRLFQLLKNVLEETE